MVTAVEWMFDKLLEEGPSGELRWHLKHDIFKIFEQAKEMEKNQIIDAHLTGLIHPLEMEATKQAEQYYKETYETSNI